MVIGVEPEFCASYTAALRAGRPVPAPFTPTLADGLAVPLVGAHAFEVARHYVDECVLTTEKDISLAVLRLIENEKIVVEGGGAAGLAALLPGGPLDRADMKGKSKYCFARFSCHEVARKLTSRIPSIHSLL
jgi:threonine dehydratase